MSKDPDVFTEITAKATEWFGSPAALMGAIAIVVVWLIGIIFVPGHFANNGYQLAINSLTTIITFLMVFLIQADQNRQGRAINAKLDAILKRTEALPDEFVGIEALPESEIVALQEKLAETSDDEEAHEHLDTN